MRPIGLLLLLVGCSATDTGNPWAGAIDTLPNGAVRVTNPAEGLWTDATRWRLAPALAIGEMDGPDATVFSAIAGLEVDDAGRIYVLDRQANELRIFTPDGAHVQTVGRSGEGPGEYANANGLIWARPDTLVVIDQRGARYTLLGRDGEYLGSQLRRLGFYGWVFSGGYADGRIYERAFVAGPDGTQPALVATPLAGPSAGQATADLDTLPLPAPTGPTVEGFSVMTERGGMTMSVPFAAGPVYQLDRAGTLWHGHGSEFRIARSSLAGDTLLEIVLDAVPTPVTPHERSEWEDSEMVQRFRNMGGQLDMDRVPRVKPFFDVFHLDPHGYLWVGVPASPMQVVFAVFDDQGRYLGRLSVEGVERNAFVMPVVRNARLHLAGRDEMDVPRVYVFDIER
jgi:hypothetical protein